MELVLAPVVQESSSKVQDRMGDVYSKDFKNLKSPQRELLQVDSKQSSPNFLECSEALLNRAPYIVPTEDFPVYSSFDSFVDIAVEALEDFEISKEKETISCVGHSSNPLILEGHNTSHPITSDKTIQQINFEEKISTKVIQKALSLETESTEIPPALFAETESNEEIQPALSMETESAEEIQPALSVETESAEEIQPALSVETESAEEIQFEKTELTKSVHPVHSETKLYPVNQPVLSEEFHLNEAIESHSMAASSKEKITFPPESEKCHIFSNDTNSSLDPEVLSKVISELELHLSNEEENSNSSFPPALETDSFLSLLNTEEYNNASLLEYVNDKAVSGGSVIVTPTSPSPEPIFPNLVMPPLSPPTGSPPMKSNEKQNRSSESIKPVVSVETKLSKVKQPVLSEEINLNEVIELNSLEARSIEKAISSFQSKTSPIPSSDMDSSAEQEALSKVLSKTDLDSSNSEDQSKTSRIPSNDRNSSAEVLSKGLSKTDLDPSNSEENSNSFPPTMDTEGFFSLLNTDEYKNASHLGLECIRQVNQSGGHVIFSPRSPLPEPKFPIFEMPPLSPTTESRLAKMIENFNKISLSNLRNLEATLKFQNSEEKSNPTVPPVLDNERFGSVLNMKGSNYEKPSGIPGNGGMMVNTSTPCQSSSLNFEMLPSPTAKNLAKKSVGNLRPCKDAIVPTDIPRTTCEPSSLNFEMLPSLPTKKPQVKSVENLNPTKDAIVPTGIPSTTCKPSSLNFEMIPSPPARNRPKKSVGNLNPAKDVIVPTGIPSTTCRLIFPNLEVPPLSSPATKKSVGNLKPTKGAVVPTDIPRTTCEPSSLNFQMIPTTSAQKHPTKSLGNLRPSKDAMVPTDIPSTTCKTIFSNLEVPPLSPSTNRTKKSVGNSRPTKEAIISTDIPRTTCEPSSLNFEMLQSPPARNHPKKLAGNLRPTKDGIIPTDVPSTTCKPISPNLEVPPLSPIAKNDIKHLSPTKDGTVPNNRLLSKLLSKLADWIYEGMEKSSNSFEKPLDIDFINNFKMELEKGVDVLDEMARFMDILITAVEGLPDPNSILPYELGSEEFSIRDRLVNAGLVVQRELEKMKKGVISDRDAFFCLSYDEGKLSNTEALKAHDVIFRLFVKISEHYLKLGMDIEKFRDNNRDFCYKMDILQNGMF